MIEVGTLLMLSSGSQKHTIKFVNSYVSVPFVESTDGTKQRISTMECRRRGLSYASTVYVDIEYTIVHDYSPENPNGSKTYVRKYKSVPLCQIPVMIHSVRFVRFYILGTGRMQCPG